MAPARRKVAVVGGGVVGCAVAFELCRAGLDVSLLEGDAIAAHASGCNAGKLNPLYGTDPALIPFALEAFRLHAEIRTALAELGCRDFSARPVDRLLLGFQEAERESLEQTGALYRSVPGFSARWLDHNEIRHLEPRLAPDAAFGVLTSGSLSVQSGEFTRALARGASKLGAKIILTKAAGLETHGDRVVGVRTGDGIIPCDEVVLATGPWVGDSQNWLGLDIPVRPVKGEMVLLRLSDDGPPCDITHGKMSLYRKNESHVWIGVTVKEHGFDAAPTSAARESLINGAERLFCGIRRSEVLDHVAALRPVAIPNAPIAKRAPGWRNVVIANGGGSKGMLFSAGIARSIRRQLTERAALLSAAG